MTQKTEQRELVSSVLQSVDPSTIADESLRQIIEILLNRIEQLEAENKALQEENQKLRDENNRLKGEQGKPDIKAKNKKDLSSEYDSDS
jgi:cell division protein FtsB